MSKSKPITDTSKQDQDNLFDLIAKRLAPTTPKMAAMKRAIEHEMSCTYLPHMHGVSKVEWIEPTEKNT
jgi:hypothetical protein